MRSESLSALAVRYFLSGVVAEIFALLLTFSLLSGCGSGGGDGGSAKVDDGGPRSADVQADPLASRTSGVAPLAVYFQAQATDLQPGVDPFLGVEYRWDFGEAESAGNWQHSGFPKDWDYGPNAGHVYERPGTYTVRLRAYDGGVLGSDRTVQITVQDPDIVFAGELTRCFSQTANFDGAPPGAMLVQATSLSQVVSHLAKGRRLLLRRGQTWTAGTTQFAGTFTGPEPGIIGAFGPGASPVIRTSGQLFAPRWTDWRIMDLAIEGTGSEARAFRAGGPCSKVTVFRCSARDVKTGFTFSTSQIPGGPLYDQCHVIECTVNRVIGGSGGYASMFAGTQALLLGNSFDDTTQAEHVVRAPHLMGAVIAHNFLSRSSSSKHVLKLHGPPFTGGGLGAGQYTERVVVRRNLFRGGNGAWTVAVGPEDDHTDQRVRQVVVENNHWRGGSGQGIACYVSCQQFIARNNLIDMTGANGATAFSLGRRGVEPIPSDMTILHNTCYTADPDRFTLLDVGQATDVLSRGNLGCARLSPRKTLLAGSAVSQFNLLLDDPSFVVAAPFAMGEFALQVGSPARNVATPIAELWDDILAERRRDGRPDVGAFEVFTVPPPDADGDGVPDAEDNCPLVANSDQEDADNDGQGDLCEPPPDEDLDGVSDTSDNCPVVANPGQEDTDNDMNGDACDVCPNDSLDDADSDGVCGSVDNCSFLANPGQEDLDGDGEGDACDLDDDGDGVISLDDNCPLVPNADQSDRDGDQIGDPCDETPDPPEPPFELIVDDHPAKLPGGFASWEGEWYPSAEPNHFGQDSRYMKYHPGDWYQWNAESLPAGEYDVYAWWTTKNSRSTAASYRVSHSDGESTVEVDQRANGGQWNLLGRWRFDGAAAVRLTHQVVGQAVSADAIRWVKR